MTSLKQNKALKLVCQQGQIKTKNISIVINRNHIIRIFSEHVLNPPLYFEVFSSTRHCELCLHTFLKMKTRV